MRLIHYSLSSNHSEINKINIFTVDQHKSNNNKNNNTSVVYLTTPSVSQSIHLRYLCVVSFLHRCVWCIVAGTLIWRKPVLMHVIELFGIALQWQSRLTYSLLRRDNQCMMHMLADWMVCFGRGVTCASPLCVCHAARTGGVGVKNGDSLQLRHSMNYGFHGSHGVCSVNNTTLYLIY